jgi:hypothetical protein
MSFDPYAFAERWYEEHPEALKGFDLVDKMKKRTTGMAGKLLQHHYDHPAAEDNCVDCLVKGALFRSEVGERQIRDFLGFLDDLGVAFVMGGKE